MAATAVRHFVHISKRKSTENGRTASDVPRDQQCTQLKAHRMLPGERCALCAGQLGLFDLDETNEMEVR